jgi:hypothetical protein
MSFSLTAFANSPGPAQLSALDNNVTTLSAAAPINCVISGTNTLQLSQNIGGAIPSILITGYSNGMLFSGVAAGNNTGFSTAQVGSFAALGIYKDSTTGPTILIGGEIVAGNAISLLYDSTLASGAGGFHLIASTSITRSAQDVSALRVGNNFISTFNNLLSGTVALTFTATPGWSSQDQAFTLTGLPPAIPFTGDFVLVNPPSLAATGVGYQAMITATGSLSSVSSVATVNVRLINSASASLASNSGVYHWTALRMTP